MVAQQNYDQGFNWMHQDHLGSGHKMTNTSGAVVFTEQYDPHGQKLMQTSNNGAFYLSKKFTGYERDYGTNTDNAKARQYHHNNGRFMQPDPLSLGASDLSNPQSLNLYSYVQNDPVNNIDPSGLQMRAIVVHTWGHRLKNGDYYGDWETYETYFYDDGTSYGGGEIGNETVQLGFLGSIDVTPPVIRINTTCPSVSNAVGGGSFGAAIGVIASTVFHNNPKLNGEARIGRPSTNPPFYWDRSFHLDGPHGPVRTPHFNADFGPLAGYNHNPISPTLKSFGSTSALRAGGKVLGVAGLGLDAYNIYSAAPGRPRNKAIGGAVGGFAGAATGAAIGSMFCPGPGTVIGGIIGGVGGGILGEASR